MQFENRNKKRYFMGILMLLGVVILWVGSSFLINSIFTEQSFDHPFFLTYFNTSTFSIYLILVFFQRRYQKFKNKRVETSHKSPLVSPELNVNQYGLAKDLKLQDLTELNSEEEEEEEITTPSNNKLSDKETAKLSFYFCLLWFAANWSNNASLSLTSVASSTILSSTSGIFTLIFGSLFKVERFTLVKLSGILVSLLGVVLVGLSDMGTDSSLTFNTMVIGDILSILGAVFYAFYTTFLKIKVDEEKVDMKLFLGFVGLINLVIMIPVMILIHYINVEPFSFPPTSTVWAMLFLNAFFGTFLSDYLWIFAVLFTSPLVVTLGLSLTIPFAMVGDILINGKSITTIYGCGALFVIIGFFMVNSVAYQETVNKRD
ncbi:hypothetical protein K502DRAFT_323004 [Neoconidiobolus thromboides FSU 785]|nr:hypothetical protein K502DRAFT_323004 [Neoconidiobolus thromboides FSU 785]